MPTLSPAIIDAFADAARRGVPIETTCTILGVPPRTFHQWMADAQATERADGTIISNSHKTAALALLAAIKRGQAEAEAEAIEKLRNWRSSKTGDDDWRQHAWYLTHGPARRRWYEYKERAETEPQAIPAAFQVVRTIEDRDLLALHSGTSEEIADTSENA